MQRGQLDGDAVARGDRLARLDRLAHGRDGRRIFLAISLGIGARERASPSMSKE